jgi:hypothetical protein
MIVDKAEEISEIINKQLKRMTPQQLSSQITETDNSAQ